MLDRLPHRYKPKQGFAHFFHLAIVALIPIAILTFVRLDLVGIALAVILLSKFQIFAVKPRHWLAHIRTNAVDIIFSLSMLTFIANTSQLWAQLLWVALYELWILYIKPGSTPLFVSGQAALGQLVGLSALFQAFEEVPIAVFILGGAVVLYYSARHFFGSFEEPNYHVYVWIWTTFGACLIWVLSHWLLFYGSVAQPAVLLSVIGYGIGGIYYLYETNKLSQLIQRQIIFAVFAIVIVLLALSNWGGRTI